MQGAKRKPDYFPVQKSTLIPKLEVIRDQLQLSCSTELYDIRNKQILSSSIYGLWQAMKSASH